MLTRSGWGTVIAAMVAIGIGRVLGIVELYVLAAGALAAVILAMASLRIRRLRIDVDRWVHPPVLTVGDRGRVDLTITNMSRLRSPRAVLLEPVGNDAAVRIGTGRIRAAHPTSTAYRLPAERRGVLPVGPTVATRQDLLGLSAVRREVAPRIDVIVAPQVLELSMPHLGQGSLGRHLLAQSRRLGLGEFHGLRDYVDGDEPRIIHWRASARSDELKVREYTAEGVRRCIVVLDRDARSVPDDDPDAFERAVVAAASLVTAGDHAGLTTRFVTADDTGGTIDLRGPDVAATTLRVLAAIQPGSVLDHVDRDPGDGLGLVIVITSHAGTDAWYRTEQLLDPGLTRVGVFTAPGLGSTGRMGVDASTTTVFRTGWDTLCGHGSLDVRRVTTNDVDGGGVNSNEDVPAAATRGEVFR